MRPSTPPAAAYWMAVALCLGAALVGIWWPPYTPGQDTPHHLFFAQVIATPERFAADYDVVLAPTSQGFVYLASLFVPWLGLVAAGKAVRTLALGLLLWAYWRIGRAVGHERPVGAILGLAAAASFFHAMGFENFALAMPLGLLALGLALDAARSGRWRSWMATGAVLLVCSAAHSVVGGMVGVELLLGAVLAAPPGMRLRRLGQLCVVAVPAAAHALFGVWLSAKYQEERGVAAGLGTQRLDLDEQLVNVVEHSLGGYSHLGFLVVAAAVAIAIARRRGAGGLGERLALATLALWGLLYALTPFHAAGWAYAQPRTLMLLVLVPLGLIGWGRRPVVALAAAVLAVLLFLADSAWNQRVAGEAVAEQVARIGAEPTGHAMVVTLDPGHPPTSEHVGPLFGSALYAVALGGAVPHIEAANPAIHAVIARRPESAWPPHPPLFIHKSLDCSFNRDCEDAALNLAQRIAAEGLAFDAVLLVGGPEAFRTDLEARGYVRLRPDRFAPRPAWLEIALDSPAGLARRGLAVRAGYPEGFGWFTGALRPRGPSQNGERLILGPLPAGPIQIDCRWVDGQIDAAQLDDAPPACAARTALAPGERTQLSISLVE